MNALLRKISPYTAPDVLLGVFATETEAQGARDAYFSQRSADPSADPWLRQAYKPAGLHANDLRIVAIDAPGSPRDGDEIFVVSNYKDAFGQVVRDIDSIHLSEAAARSRISEIDRVNTGMPSYALLQRVHVGAIHSDMPDQQPRLSFDAYSSTAGGA